MPIVFNRVNRSFKLTISSTDEEKILKVAKLADELGLDGTLEETTPELQPEVAQRKERVVKPTFVYGFLRDKVLGYIGTSSRLEERFQEHTRNIALSQWIKEGIEVGDFSVSISEEGYSRAEAFKLEKRYTRKLDPLFGIHNKRLISVERCTPNLLELLPEN